MWLCLRMFSKAYCKSYNAAYLIRMFFKDYGNLCTIYTPACFYMRNILIVVVNKINLILILKDLYCNITAICQRFVVE